MRIRKSRWIGMEGEAEQLEIVWGEFTADGLVVSRWFA
jgi:hypothetical protein